MARFVKEAEENASSRRPIDDDMWTTIADQLLAAVAVEKSVVTETKYGNNGQMRGFLESVGR